jgi:ribonuclease HI
MESNWVTLYTDASGLGGYGIYGVSSYGRLERGGKCSHRDSIACELFAILQGIRECVERWRKIEGVLVRSDSQQALKLAINAVEERFSRRSDLKEIQQALKDTVGDEVELRAKWVRGHQNSNSSSAYLNRKVDKLAAEYSR